MGKEFEIESERNYFTPSFSVSLQIHSKRMQMLVKRKEKKKTKVSFACELFIIFYFVSFNQSESFVFVIP